MSIQTQGEDYEENQTAPQPRARARRQRNADVEEDEEVVDEEEEEIPAKKSKAKQQSGNSVNPMLIACGVGIAVLAIITISLVVFLNGNAKKKEALDGSKEFDKQMEMANDTFNDVPLDTPIDTPMESGDSLDAPMGSDITQVPVEVSDDTSSTSGGVGEFSGKTADTLRKWGFTNNQMEIASRDGISAEAMVEQAKQERKMAQYEAMMEASDEASEAYQKLLNQTWLGQPPMDISGFDRTDVMYSTETYTENVDYEKVEAHGMQLWIKCYLDNGMTAFMQCSPARYNALSDAGNIVISYTVVVQGDTKVITQINEYKVGN